MVQKLSASRVLMFALLLVLIVCCTICFMGASSTKSEGVDEDIPESSVSDRNLSGSSASASNLEYVVDYSLIGVSAEAYVTASIGSDYSVKFIPMADYTMPDGITVSVGNKVISPADYKYNASACTLLIPSDVISGNISITVTATSSAAASSGSGIINKIVYIGMGFCVITMLLSTTLLATDKRYKGKV